MMNRNAFALALMLAGFAMCGRAEDTSPPPVCNCKPMAVTVTHVGTLATDAVGISNFLYNSANLTINVGDTVTWTNSDAATHTATSDKPLFDTGNLTTGQSASFTFTKAGTYPYHCTIHPFMIATITVLPTTTVPLTLTGTWSGTFKGKPFSQTGTSAKTVSEIVTFTFVQTGSAITATLTVGAASAIDAAGLAGNTNFWLSGGDATTTYALSGHLDKAGKTFSGTAIVYDLNGAQELTFKAKRLP